MRIVTCVLGIVLASSTVGCGEERVAPASSGSLPSTTAASGEAAPTAPTAPVATDVTAGATETATGLGYGTPHPEPAVDADDCVRRWNAPTNAAARAEVAGSARGAFVGLEYDGERRCEVSVTAAAAPDAAGRLVYYAEYAAGAFRSPGGASGVSAAAERPVDLDGRIGPPIAGPSPAPEPPAETGWPVGTVGGVGLSEGAPPPDPVVGTDDCVQRWNGDANIAARDEVAGRARGAFVRLRYDDRRACTILLAARDAGGLGGGPIYVEVAAGAFRELAATGAFTAPPERSVDDEGRVGELLTPLPPPADIVGIARLGIGTHCWQRGGAGVCVDAAAPQCGDGVTPRALVETGAELRFELGFEPSQPPLLRIGGAHPVEVELPAADAIAWTVPLPPDRYPVSLVATGAGGDVEYTVCLDVERSRS